MKSEIGEVISVVKGASACYQVRLKRGEIVSIAHQLITPTRVTLVPKGTPLMVTHELGIVQFASTDLSMERRGTIVAIQKQGLKTRYQVDLDQGQPVTVSQELVTPHPQRDLLKGSILLLNLDGEQVVKAQLLSEEQPARVIRIDQEKRVVYLNGNATHEDYSVRLTADSLRQVKPGDQLTLKVEYNPQGERSIILEKNSAGEKEAKQQGSSAPPARPSFSLGEKTPVNPSPAAVARQPTRQTHPPQPAPQSSESFAGQEVGIDPVYLAARTVENHRHEIMKFITDHRQNGLIEWYRMRPEKKPRYTVPGRPLGPFMQKAVQETNDHFQGFYQHQTLALEAIRQNRNLMIVTQTASGKTLCYNPAIFEHLIDHPSDHTLYIFPLNALMNDQKEKLDALRASLKLNGVELTSELLMGGMGDQRLHIAQNSPNLLATNPEMLSVMLNEAPRHWRQFFGNLKHIVIDEVHAYRGIFGLQMAGIIRRLLLTARRLGADPSFILSSATVSNPLDLASRLTSIPSEAFTLISEAVDGSKQACKHWLVLNPDWGANQTRTTNYLNVAAHVFLELIQSRDDKGKPSPLRTILFARSIRDVNRLHRQIQENIRNSAPHLKNKIRQFASADLSPAQKREIYQGLRSGELLGIISTNALEAGIDIGSLDACIIAGFPFSVMGMRQMAGRVGRREEGLVAYIPYMVSGLDQYYRDQPDLLINQPPEVFIVDPENFYIARKHINAAAYALGGLSAQDLLTYWGPRAIEAAQQSVRDQVMRLSQSSYLGSRRDYNNPNDPYAVQSLRSNVQQPFVVCLDSDEPCANGPSCSGPGNKNCEKRVVVLDREYIYRDCHPGAIYESTNDGKLYPVNGFDDRARIVRVKLLEDATLERTFVEENTEIKIKGIRAQKNLQPGVDLVWGEVEVQRSFTGYFTHTLQPGLRCRHCRITLEGGTHRCPSCSRLPQVVYTYSRPERQDFPAPNQTGFQIILNTIACWLVVEPGNENQLYGASACKLPGEKNRLMRWVKAPLATPNPAKLTDGEKMGLADYHTETNRAIAQNKLGPKDAHLFPGIYGHCLLSNLRLKSSESHALEIFGGITGYPVTHDLRHICRKCQSSVLMPALHTLEHTVLMRYPSIALGDMSDLSAYTTLGHSGTGGPTVFWFDNFEGGIGAAEKIYEKFSELLEASAGGILTCPCNSLEGCPRCSQISGCSERNENLSKPAALALINLLTGKAYALGYFSFVYRKKQEKEFAEAYASNQTAPKPHGMGEEAPPSQAAAPPDPHHLLRIQRQIHAPVLRKAFDIRSREIGSEAAPPSAQELADAYKMVSSGPFLQDWQNLKAPDPYQKLEILPSASTRMVNQIYHIIAFQVHPDKNPERVEWANDMMKAVNSAKDAIMAERRNDKTSF